MGHFWGGRVQKRIERDGRNCSRAVRYPLLPDSVCCSSGRCRNIPAYLSGVWGLMLGDVVASSQ